VITGGYGYPIRGCARVLAFAEMCPDKRQAMRHSHLAGTELSLGRDAAVE